MARTLNRAFARYTSSCRLCNYCGVGGCAFHETGKCIYGEALKIKTKIRR